MTRFSIATNDVKSDLQDLQSRDINAYGRIAALLQELYQGQGTKHGQDLIDQLNIQGRQYNVATKMVGQSLKIEHEKLQRDLWRLKLWTIDTNGNQHLEPYRVIYGFFPVSQFRKIPEVRIFAVPYRAKKCEDSYDYQPTHPISIRIRMAYDAYF